MKLEFIEIVNYWITNLKKTHTHTHTAKTHMQKTENNNNKKKEPKMEKYGKTIETKK